MGTSTIILFTITIVIILLAYGIFQVHKRREIFRTIEEEKTKRQAEEEIRRKAAEKEARLLVEEARRKVEEDAKRKAEEEETRRKIAEEEARLLVEEEARRKIEEDSKRQAEKEAQRKAEKDAQWAAKSIMHKRAPEDRGGQPKKLSDKDDNDVEKTKALLKAVKEKAFSLRPEVICWKDAHKWFVGIEIQEKYQEYEGIVVTQDGVPIQKDDRGRWVLLQTIGIVQVRWEEVGYQKEIPLEKPYLIFRLAGQKINRGCLVRYATFGSYLVIVPDNWQRDEVIAGPAKLSPEPVYITTSLAHYFLLERGSESKIGFRTSAGEPITVDTRASRFELIGNVLSSDASDDIGPLFAGNPPNIKAVDEDSWKGIKTIVLGQEGSGKKRWRTHFAPKADSSEQVFPEELGNRRGGWYFLRFYDLEDTLVESMDFRFVSALKEIVVHPHLPLPSLDGHSSVSIEFVHTSGCAIHLAEGSDESLQVQRTEDKTAAFIPPDPVWDRTSWSIDINDKTHIDAVILAQRVWWAIGNEEFAKVQPHWSDKPLVTPRDAFSATSKKILWLRLPRERWTDTVQVGFTGESRRPYHVEVTKKYVAIPLSHFAGYQELEDKFLEHSLCLWIADKGATVIKILPDKPLHQVIESPQASIRPTPAPAAPVVFLNPLIFKSYDYSNTPIDRKCCSTCNYAIVIHGQSIRCTVGTWEKMMDWDTFFFHFATHTCSRWQGEYRGPDGNMVSK